MKNLIDVIEKLDIGKVSLDTEFPIEGSEEEIAKFLKLEGFSQYKNRSRYSDRDVICQNYDGKMFFRGVGNLNYIIFANNENGIDIKDNPIFYIMVKQHNNAHIYYIEDKSNSEQVTKEEFLKAINKVFGW